MGNLRINDIAQLNSLSDVIHDEYLRLDDIKHDGGKGVLEIPFRRIFHYYDPPADNFMHLVLHIVKLYDILLSCHIQ